MHWGICSMREPEDAIAFRRAPAIAAGRCVGPMREYVLKQDEYTRASSGSFCTNEYERRFSHPFAPSTGLPGLPGFVFLILASARARAQKRPARFPGRAANAIFQDALLY